MTLRDEAAQYVISKGRFVKAKELTKALNISLFSLYKSIPEGIADFQENLGFKRPSKKTRTKEDTEQLLLDLIAKEARFLSGVELARLSKVSRATYKSLGINTDLLNNQLDFYRSSVKPKGGWNSGKKFTAPKEVYVPRRESVEEIRSRACEFILSQERYCPASVISDALGIPRSTLSYYSLDSIKLNKLAGFTRDNRYFESSVGKALETIYQDQEVITQKWFSECLSDAGNKLYFDFYIVSVRTLVEADGPCHYDSKHPWFTEAVQRRDYIKAEYAKEKGYRLIRIPFFQPVTIEAVLKHLETH